MVPIRARRSQDYLACQGRVVSVTKRSTLRLINAHKHTRAHSLATVFGMPTYRPAWLPGHLPKTMAITNAVRQVAIIAVSGHDE